MVPIIKQYQGTIDEFIGDAIFVLFGAPVWHEDDAERAVACAVAMQIAMDEVNKENCKEDLPEVEMGIGIHTGQVVLGNIGSPERMKYGVVGSNVNLTSRIQACTIGGQILVSETTRQEVGNKLKIGKQMEVRAKGVEQPVILFEALGIGGRHKLSLGEAVDTLIELKDEIPIALRGRGIESGGRGAVKGLRHQAIAKGRRGAARRFRASPEQSQDASRRTGRRTNPGLSLRQGARAAVWNKPGRDD